MEKYRHVNQYRFFRNAVENLAAPAEQQIEYLESIGDLSLADELALDLNDEIGMLSVFISEGLISESAGEYIRIADKILEDMSGPNDFWLIESLKNDDRWQQIREYARLALEAWNLK